eukprot:3473391-Rhodomonas_salina.2
MEGSPTDHMSVEEIQPNRNKDSKVCDEADARQCALQCARLPCVKSTERSLSESGRNNETPGCTQTLAGGGQDRQKQEAARKTGAEDRALTDMDTVGEVEVGEHAHDGAARRTRVTCAAQHQRTGVYCTRRVQKACRQNSA